MTTEQEMLERAHLEQLEEPEEAYRDEYLCDFENGCKFTIKQARMIRQFAGDNGIEPDDLANLVTNIMVLD